ncbi:hypothetical protein GE09DRAFT_1112202 [Coniochaeta sp. 2T2.1]|nr:hypothetical protein GE09DRAFT_1112202 [Coniochaeta sp. 2T2.1]
MMATRADFGFPPKKRITMTYGKAGRRFGASSDSSTSRKQESSPAAPKPEASIWDVPTDDLADTPSRQMMSQLPRRKPARRTISEPILKSEAAVPVTEGKTTAKEDAVPRAKKRKVEPTPTPSPEKAKEPDTYSPPSPPPLAASPRRPMRPVASKSASSLLTSRRKGAAHNSPMSDIEKFEATFSAKTSKALHDPSIDSQESESSQTIPIRLTEKRSPRSFNLTKKLEEPTVQKTKPTVPTSRRKRLIDALAAQEDSSEDEQMLSQQTVITSRRGISPAMDLTSSPPSSQTEQPKPRTLQRQLSTARRPGPKYTYSQQRTMLAEESLVDITTFAEDEESQKRPAFFGLANMHTTSNLSAFSFVDDEDDTVNTGAVKSLHELRQAGANNRFSFEMDDVLVRVGSPSAKYSSLRRGALLEVAEKMKDTDFRRQLRNHNNVGDLFTGLAKETDLVAGYAILAIITTLLATSTSQHLILQIQSEGISHLLLLLLEESSDISVIAKDRKRNVSRHAQTTLTVIKNAVLKLPVWEPASPTLLPPRTLALKALELIMRGPASETELFSPTITDHLFEMVSDYENPACWDFPAQHASLDFYLALHLLEQHSVSAMQSTSGARWATEYLPTVAGVLGVALQRPVDKFDDLETSTLKLTLNMTNNNHETPAMFVSKGLLRDLAEAACRTFDVVNRSIIDDAFLSKVYDSLILMLGVKINFCEHYSPAAQDLMDAGEGDTSPLSRLIRVFLDYHAVHAEADSMEKTSLNVAFGYLAILLGHLCLHQPIRERFMSIYGKRNLEPLLESIRIFITLHRVTLAAMEDEPSQKGDSNAADRLQSLVDQLESQT